MALFKKIVALTVTTLALGCGTASASVIAHVHEDMASGATFDGDITFADQYTSILGVDGYLDGSVYGHDHMTWTYDATYHDGTETATGLPGVVTDFLLDGDAVSQDFSNYLGISWKTVAGTLVIDIDPQIPTDYAGVDDADRAISAAVGDGSAPSNVPEPASMALLGLGLAGLAAARRRKA